MSRNRSPTVPPASQHTAVSPKTLRLFTVSSSDDAAAVDAEAAAVASVASSTSGRTTDSVSTVRSKNPRWLASREKETQSEAIREKMLALVADIEAEEARERPAMKKAWLHDKKMELRKLSFKQPEGIIAGEPYFRKVRRKLLKARQAGRDGGGDSGDEDSGRNGEAGDEDENDDEATASSVLSERRSTSTRKFRAGGRLNEGEEPSDDDDDDDDDASNAADGAFDVSPEGRLARRNPRAEAGTAEEPRKAGWRGPMKKMSKAVRAFNSMELGSSLGEVYTQDLQEPFGTILP